MKATFASLLFRLAPLLSLSMIAVEATAAQRGISVVLRQSESPTAPVLEERELYQESYALVIGIDGYSNGWPKLSNAVRDAEAIADVLNEKGFEVELHKDPNAADLPQIFKRFFILKGENPEARLFVWFAGHGATVDGEGYLIPADAPVISKSTEFKFSSVALRDFGTFMRQSASKHVYAVFDACFAGTVFTAQRAMPPAAITRATTLPVRQFLTSGDAEQTVSDDGQFRELFVRAISGEEPADANNDGYLTASELGMYLGDRVTNLTESAQTPRYGKLRDKDYDRGDFVFLLDGKTRKIEPVSRGAEVVFWESVQDATDVDMLLAYLSEYPEGKFANLARIKLSRLGAVAEAGLAKWLLEPTTGVRAANRAITLRGYPSQEAAVISEIQPGQILELHGKIDNPEAWLYVAIGGLPVGYIEASALQEVTIANGQVTISGNSSPDDPVESATGDRRSSKEPWSSQLAGVLDDAIARSADGSNPSVVDSGSQMPGAISMASNGMGEGEGLGPNAADDQSSVQNETQTQSEDGDVRTLVQGSMLTTEVAKSEAPLAEPQAAEQAAGASQRIAVGPTDSGTKMEAHDRAVGVPGDKEQPIDHKAQEPGSQPEASEAAVAIGEASPALNLATDDGPSVVEVKALPREATPPESSTSSAAGQASVAAKAPSKTSVSREGSASLQQSAAKRQNEQVEQAIAAEAITSDQSVAPVDTPSKSLRHSQFVSRYIDAAVKGNVGAQATLGYFYETGEHVSKDIEEAIRWYEAAAKNDHVQALVRLASIEDARGNEAVSFTWYLRAATLGSADAQAMLGYFYQKGDRVTADIEAAIKWYLAAAEQNNAAAQNNLGLIYQVGDGVPKNLDQAIFWYERAADNGSASAARNLEKLLP